MFADMPSRPWASRCRRVTGEEKKQLSSGGGDAGGSTIRNTRPLTRPDPGAKLSMTQRGRHWWARGRGAKLSMTHVRPVHPVSSEQAAQQCHLSARRGKGGKPWAESTEHGTECVRSSHGSSTRVTASRRCCPPPPPPSTLISAREGHQPEPHVYHDPRHLRTSIHPQAVPPACAAKSTPQHAASIARCTNGSAAECISTP